ncbi:hypothetical protein Leryth_005730 [Lithospermum erythrorhizon]|nr:hypothetical protein Leryth_005730 [Lithospermum erythrorhizon]
MSCSKFSPWSSSNPTNHNLFSPNQNCPTRTISTSSWKKPSISCSLRKLKERLETVKNTQKVTEAMKLVSAAKVRRAQEAVINGRPFSESLVEVLFSINEQLQYEDVEIPLTNVRPIKNIALVVITGDRGLCGGFNNAIIKKAEMRIQELRNLGIGYTLISVGKKEVDKVELLYSKFLSLIKSNPVTHTLLPLSPKGGAFDVNGNSVDVNEDEFFRLTTKGGKLIVERDHMEAKSGSFSSNMEFEQDPAQILDALMPLYLNSQILKALQESFASELSSRMNAMSNATDNAADLKRDLSIQYNRGRQSKITNEILEIVAGAEALL